jgi:hypothetical protein
MKMASEAGKGDKRRPTDTKLFETNFKRIFGKPKKSQIDTVGQNGNEGIHYDSDDAVDRWSAVLRDEYDSKYWKDQ